MSPYTRLPKAIFERFVAGESIEEIAKDFDINTDECARMLRIHCKVIDLGKSARVLNRLLGKFVAGNPPKMNYEAICFAASYAHHYKLTLPDWVLDEYRGLCKKLVGQANE